MRGAYEFTTNTPLILDTQRRFLVDDVALVRTSPPLTPPFIGTATSSGIVERCVVVHRQSDGFGLTVTGDHPVYVHTVRPDGAAYCAGVRQGDRILKVNGMPVTSSNHLEVVRMISGGHNVVLTLLGKPPEHLPVYIQQDTEKRPIEFEETNKDKEEWKWKRKELLAQMLEEQKRHVESLRASSCEGDQLSRAVHRINTLQLQLDQHSPPAEPPWMQVAHPNDLSAMDSDVEDEAIPPMSSNSPFDSLPALLKHPAHLSVFLTHLMLNANPSSLLFYSITDCYQSASGPPKDWRRWLLEIFSTFLVPNSPITIPGVDQTIIQPIDKLLASTVSHVSDSDVEGMRRAFAPARLRATTDINQLMADFRHKIKMGLSTFFDPQQLNALLHDPPAQLRFAEQNLSRTIDQLISSSPDLDAADSRTQALASGVATLLRVVMPPKPSGLTERVLDRIPTFVAKEKGGKFKSNRTHAKKTVQVKDHVFSYCAVSVVHYCYQCSEPICGIQPYAYFCANCDVVVHKNCTASLTDACYPATVKTKGKAKSKMGVDDEKRDSSLLESRPEQPARESVRVGTPSRAAAAAQPPETTGKSASSDSGIGNDLHDRPSVARSHSMRTGLDPVPSLSSLSVSDDHRGRVSAQSWGVDHVLTPADELEETQHVAIRESRGDSRYDLLSESGSSTFSHAPMKEEEVRQMMEHAHTRSIAECDSDLEVETEVPSLESLVGWDVIRHLKPKEKKRQEVINELFHTERTHVRNLKILYKIFYQPMLIQNVVAPEVVNVIFANIGDLLDVHVEMNKKMRKAVDSWRRDPNLNGLYGDVGDLMLSLLDGESGERLRNVTAQFCQQQQHALDILRARYKKDKEDAFSRFLTEAESHPICRKLQLKDMLPVEMQRLVKYPLLLETVAKYTNDPSEEQDKVLQAVTLSKHILSAVNSAKRNAENLRRLEDLQRRLDTTPFDKEFSGHDYAALNLTKFCLVHDGPLTCRFNRGKMVELHVVLLENKLVLLTKHSDGHKLQLKLLEPSKETKWTPILPLAPLIIKEKANDKRAFFLVFNSHTGAQIFELVAATATERKTWFKLMSDQIEHNASSLKGSDSCNFDLSSSGETCINADGTMAKVHVLTHPRLVNANEITIQQPTIFEHAKPVLTPTERLKRDDQVIFQALLDKHTILAEFLPGDKRGRIEELDKLGELLGGMGVTELKRRDCRELAMSAIVHGNRLLDSINQSMNARKDEEGEPGSTALRLADQDPNLPAVPCYKLTAIAAPLMNHLKALMQTVQDQQSELATVKQQLYHYKELAESPSRGDRSVSEETLTDLSDGERKLMTKRQRAPSIPPVPPPML